jgi:hypothetical protein
VEEQFLSSNVLYFLVKLSFAPNFLVILKLHKKRKKNFRCKSQIFVIFFDHIYQGPIPQHPQTPHHQQRQVHSPPISQPHSPGVYPQHWASPQMSPHPRPPHPIEQHQMRHPSPASSPPVTSPSHSQQCKKILYFYFIQISDFNKTA